MSWLFALVRQSMGASAFCISPSNEYSGLISFTIDFLAVSKGLSRVFSTQFKIVSTWWSNFMDQLSHPYMTTGKKHTFDYTFVSKVISQFFNRLSRFVIAFLQRSKYLSTLWLQSPSAVILEPKKINSHCFHCFPIYLP